MKKIYVIGHKNPDTDSIVSSIAYAELKKALGHDNYVPARAGKVNLQTEYILDRFHVPKPEFISDLIPKVMNHMSNEPDTLSHNTPLWEAMQLLNTKKFRMLPVVDDDNKYLSALHYNTFAENILNKIDPHKNSIISTSVYHLTKTLNAQPIVVSNEDEVFKAQIIVAASEKETLRKFIDIMPAENSIVIVGDRKDIQEYVIKKKVKVLIVSAGNMISRELKELAEIHNVSVLITPFHTSSASWLALHSVPVKYVGDTSLKPLDSNDYIRNIRDRFTESASRSLPVVDEHGRVTGVLTQSDLMNEPNIGVVLVDHNELTQSVEGVDKIRIHEIIDHHRLGNPSTGHPITFINWPVGSTSTIIANLYRDNTVPVTREVASLLLAGILSDTLILRSATTTETDIRTAEYLSQITDLSIEEFGNEITAAASLISQKPVDEIVTMDLKSYTEGEFSFSVSQVEVNYPGEIMERSESILQYIQNICDNKGLLFCALLVTDLHELSSYLFIRGKDEFIKKIAYPKFQDSIYLLKDVLSRKKQLLPYIMEILRKL
ncbi:MAG TPA: putative manganese-dependent inorganic diphosphatase [Spirochaetota bacterium]|nr:putative manganese-dependent inorganic diphosphatase [Spirochaetota bacterium]